MRDTVLQTFLFPIFFTPCHIVCQTLLATATWMNCHNLCGNAAIAKCFIHFTLPTCLAMQWPLLCDHSTAICLGGHMPDHTFSSLGPTTAQMCWQLCGQYRGGNIIFTNPKNICIWFCPASSSLAVKIYPRNCRDTWILSTNIIYKFYSWIFLPDFFLFITIYYCLFLALLISIPVI